MMNVGIFGSGAVTNRHIRNLKKYPDVRIIGRWSSDPRQKPVNGATGTIEYENPEKLLEDVDGIVVTETGNMPLQLVEKALRQARHVFMYPNLVSTAEEALHLIKLAQEADAVLHAGLIGSFDPNSLAKSIPDVKEIKFFELHYYKGIGKSLSGRSIYNALMIIAQIIHSLVKSQILSLKAKGLIMDSSNPEMISARLEYSNGCAVNITCNLLAARDDFHGSVVLNDRCIKFDLIKQKMTSWNIQRNRDSSEPPLYVQNLAVENRDVLDQELRSFIRFSSNRSEHRCNNDCGFEPFLLTERILEKVKKSVIQYS